MNFLLLYASMLSGIEASFFALKKYRPSSRYYNNDSRRHIKIYMEVLRRMKVLVKTKDLSRDEWLRYRTKGIGGSDVSIIAGINPYKSVYQI